MNECLQKRHSSPDIEFASSYSIKSRHIVSTDYSLCILCQKSGTGKLLNVSRATLSTLKKAGEVRQDSIWK